MTEEVSPTAGRQDSWSPLPSSEPEKINRFIVDGMKRYYLWEAAIDWSLYLGESAPALSYDHYRLLQSFIHKDDRWTMLTNNIDSLRNYAGGVSTTFGYSLKFLRNTFSGDDSVIAVVLYVTSNSPAEKAGLRRGDIITEVNGAKITNNNYLNMYNATSLTYRCGALDTEANRIIPVGETKSLVAVNMYENPVQKYMVIEKGAHKVGYLCYTSYQLDSEPELIEIFSSFKSSGVTDIVLDLRYNSGGHSTTSRLISSILAPEAVVKSRGVYLEHYYNDFFLADLERLGRGSREYFIDTLPVNMNLPDLYVLTSNSTASASEATMVGLAPYLNLRHIGDTTSGKFCSGILLAPENLYIKDLASYYSSFSNWGMYIMISRFFNANGVESFFGRIAPDVYVREDYYSLKPFGDINDPLLGRAIAEITGEAYTEQRTSSSSLPVETLPDIKRPLDGIMIAEP